MTKHFTSSKARRYTLQGILAASAVGLVIAGAMTQIEASAPAVAAQAETEQPVEGLDLAVYSNAMQVRRAAGLEDKDLAALGVSEAEATAVLDRLVTWCQTNEKALHRSKQAVYQAERALSEQQRLVRIGQADAGQLKDASGKAQAVENARQANRELIESGASHAMQAPALGLDKANRWRRSVELKDKVDFDLRYVPGIDARRIDDLQAQAKQEKTKIEQVMSYSERQALASVRSLVKTHLADVRTAADIAMPLPVELQPVPEAVLLEDERLEPKD